MGRLPDIHVAADSPSRVDAADYGDRGRPAATHCRQPLTGENPISLHETRLNFVLGALLDSGASSVVELGCGSGAFLKCAASQEQIRHIVGIDASEESLAVARRELAPFIDGDAQKVSLINGSCLDENLSLAGFDAAVLVETIEHLDPRRLSTLERVLFVAYRPLTIVVTTPNKEYNVLYGLGEDELREPDHRFEWSRLRFRAWAQRLARHHGYRVIFANVGECHPTFGTPTQAARFTRHDPFMNSTCAD